jgi:hypothetical protein
VKRLVLMIDGLPIEFTFPAAAGPFPYLLEVQNLRESCRAGHLNNFGVGESPSLVVALDNGGRKVATIIGQPLRARADVYDDAASYFGGYVSALEYGREILLTIEA